jgi:hypothetical protein
MKWLYELNDEERSKVLAYAIGVLEGTSQYKDTSAEFQDFADELLNELVKKSVELKKKRFRCTINSDELLSRKKNNIKIQTPKVLTKTRSVRKKEKKKENGLFGWTIKSGNK